MCNGVEFQTADSHTMEARLLIDAQVCDCARRHLSDDLNKQGGAYGVKGI